MMLCQYVCVCVVFVSHCVHEVCVLDISVQQHTGHKTFNGSFSSKESVCAFISKGA